jgi:hypothetical protein
MENFDGTHVDLEKSGQAAEVPSEVHTVRSLQELRGSGPSMTGPIP